MEELRLTKLSIIIIIIIINTIIIIIMEKEVDHVAANCNQMIDNTGCFFSLGLPQKSLSMENLS